MAGKCHDVVRLGAWTIRLCEHDDVLSMDVKHDDLSSAINSDNDLGADAGEIGARLSTRTINEKFRRQSNPVITKTTDNICLNGWVIWLNTDRDGHLAYLIKHESGQKLSERLSEGFAPEYQSLIELTQETAPNEAVDASGY